VVLPSSAVVGSAVSPLPAVIVTDSAGKPVAGVSVVFSVGQGGGVATGVTQLTGNAGIATVGGWTLGPHTGTNTMTADATGLPTVTFSLISVAGAPSKLVLVAGDGQKDTTHAVLATPLTVRATDASDNPVPGVAVQFAFTKGAGVLSPALPTDSAGLSSTKLTLGDSAGTYTVQATSGTLQGSPVNFSATATWTLYLASSIAMGQSHTCAIAPSQMLDCWGVNQHGKLGDGTTTNHLLATSVAGGLHFSRISTSGDFNCGIAAGAAYCWGDNNGFALGDGTNTDRFVPTAVLGGISFAEISVGADHSCALIAAGEAYCWGISQFGAVGDGTNANNRTSPVPVAGGFKFTKLISGYQHSCGIATTGATYCWGMNPYGELGDGTTVNRNSPAAVAGGLVFVSLAAGSNETCGITGAGDAYCWGHNDRGQLGIGNTNDQMVPTKVVGGYAFTQLAVGAAVACGITQAGSLYCWGEDTVTGGGGGSNQPIVAPRPVVAPAGLKFSAVTVGSTGGCSLTTGSAAYCWGVNVRGEVGDGTTAYRPSLVPVIGK
jgi:alpha-tubulin suppressor-like RCC1 family protein